MSGPAPVQIFSSCCFPQELQHLFTGRIAVDASNLARFACVTSLSLPYLIPALSFVVYFLAFKHHVQFNYCISYLSARCHQLERCQEQLEKTKAHLLIHFEQNRAIPGVLAGHCTFCLTPVRASEL